MRKNIRLVQNSYMLRNGKYSVVTELEHQYLLIPQLLSDCGTKYCSTALSILLEILSPSQIWVKEEGLYQAQNAKNNPCTDRPMRKGTFQRWEHLKNSLFSLFMKVLYAFSHVCIVAYLFIKIMNVAFYTTQDSHWLFVETSLQT